MRNPVHVCVRLKRPVESEDAKGLKVRKKGPEAIKDGSVEERVVRWIFYWASNAEPEVSTGFYRFLERSPFHADLFLVQWQRAFS